MKAKAVLQDIREYEKTQESLAMLKILAQSRKSLDEGKVTSAKEAFRKVREKILKVDENQSSQAKDIAKARVFRKDYRRKRKHG